MLFTARKREEHIKKQFNTNWNCEKICGIVKTDLLIPLNSRARHFQCADFSK